MFRITLGATMLACSLVMVSGLWIGSSALSRSYGCRTMMPSRASRNSLLKLQCRSSQTATPSMQSQISAVEGHISEVAESVKAVQSQIADIGVKIEETEIALDQNDLSPNKFKILEMKLKRLMDVKRSLMDEENILLSKVAFPCDSNYLYTALQCASSGR